MSAIQDKRKRAKTLAYQGCDCNDISMDTGLSFKEVSRIIENKENKKFKEYRQKKLQDEVS